MVVLFYTLYVSFICTHLKVLTRRLVRWSGSYLVGYYRLSLDVVGSRPVVRPTQLASCPERVQVRPVPDLVRSWRYEGTPRREVRLGGSEVPKRPRLGGTPPLLKLSLVPRVD